MTYWQMYFLTRLDIVLTAAGISALLSGVVIGLVLWFAADELLRLERQLGEAKRGNWTLPDVPDIERKIKETKETEVRLFTGALIIFLTSISLLLFLPSEKSMYKIIIVPKIVNNETIRSDYKELYDLAVDALKEKLKGDRR